MNIFSRCWSHRRAPVQPEPEPEGPIRIAVQALRHEPGPAAQPPAHPRADQVMPPAAARRGAPDEAADTAPGLCRSFWNCMHMGLNMSARDFIAAGAGTGSAWVLRAGLSMARTPAPKVVVAAGCVAVTGALVATHWPDTARRLVDGSPLRGSRRAENALVTLPFLLEMTAVLAPLIATYDTEDSWENARKMLIIMMGGRLSNFIRDHLTQPQQGYWGSMQPVTREGLDPTRNEAEHWRQLRTALQTLTYMGLSIAGTMWAAPAISASRWFEDQQTHADSSNDVDRYTYHISDAGPRLAASAGVEVLDPLLIAFCGFVAAGLLGLRVRYQSGEYADRPREILALRDTWRANLGSAEGRAATRERARIHTGMRMGMQSMVDVATGFSTVYAARSQDGMANRMRLLGAFLNGLTETRGFLVDRCMRPLGERALRAPGHSATLAQARYHAGQAVERVVPQVCAALAERNLEPTQDNIAALFQEFAQAPTAITDPGSERERTLFTGEVTVVAGGPAAFNRGLI